MIRSSKDTANRYVDSRQPHWWQSPLFAIFFTYAIGFGNLVLLSSPSARETAHVQVPMGLPAALIYAAPLTAIVSLALAVWHIRRRTRLLESAIALFLIGFLVAGLVPVIQLAGPWIQQAFF